jgi:UDP-N-acetylglucosamine:LPS N-acetylglucosamine transferase
LALPSRHALLVGSSGGHLTQLWALRPWWQNGERTWVTFDTPDATSLLADEQTVWAHYPTTRNIPNLFRNTLLAWKTLRRIRPDIVVSTGAGVALPFFVFARLLRIPTAYIEVYDRIDSTTLTGRLCRPFATVMCVQWDEQKALYRNAVVIGPLL